MSDLQTRYTELQSAGRVPLYCYKQATVDLDKADNVQIALGLQPNGRYLHLADLDSHTAGQDAHAARAAFALALPHVARKIEWHATPRGLHGLFETCKRLPTGRLYDPQGNHIGELLGEGSHTRDHGDITPATLTLTEIDHLFLHWSVDAGEMGSAQWKERAKEGAKLTAGYTRTRVARQTLRDFLQKECGGVGITLNAYFDDRGSFDRSAAAGNLMQTLMYHARKLPGGAAPRTVMAYWMAAESYGKASDRDYNQEKDGCSLIAQIIHGDMKKNGKPWICPPWVTGNVTTSAPAPEPTPAPRPAHRPVADRDKHLTTFRRVLESIEPDAFGRRTYTLAYLEERMKIARCAVAPRTIQGYLHDLRNAGEIVTAQIGGNGTPYAVLTRCFGGADNYQKRVETDPKPDTFWGADQIAEERILTPQTAETPLQCKEDHHNSSSPAAVPGLEALVYRDAAALAEMWAGMPGVVLLPGLPDTLPAPALDGTFSFQKQGWLRSPPVRYVRRRQRQKGQESFMGRDGIAAKISRRKHHGEAPLPTPYRPRPAPLPLETLPDPPALAGAQSGGDPLPGPQAGAAVVRSDADSLLSNLFARQDRQYDPADYRQQVP